MQHTIKETTYSARKSSGSHYTVDRHIGDTQMRDIAMVSTIPNFELTYGGKGHKCTSVKDAVEKLAKLDHGSEEHDNHLKQAA